jgi:hypothetical protein
MLRTEALCIAKHSSCLGRKGILGGAIMTNVIQQQNQFLAETKQRIVHNISNVDYIIEIALGEDVDMDPAGITLRYIF